MPNIISLQSSGKPSAKSVLLGTEGPAAAAAAAGPSVPSNTLFAEGLPEDCNEMILGMLFQQYNGYQEVRMVPGKTGIAFVDFETEVQAGIALQGLNGFKLTPTDTMRLSYRR
mmetsp:Transcript_9820/g.37002  ORF Transcript_9820/g.37002 Transcript_9820/m.37002 type:complete len:113 (-) Transcript_9820:125-463(-)